MLPLPEPVEYGQEDLEKLESAVERSDKLSDAKAAMEVEQEQKQEALDSGKNVDQDDTHKSKDASEFGLKENLQEGVNVVMGALRDEALHQNVSLICCLVRWIVKSQRQVNINSTLTSCLIPKLQ